MMMKSVSEINAVVSRDSRECRCQDERDQTVDDRIPVVSNRRLDLQKVVFDDVYNKRDVVSIFPVDVKTMQKRSKRHSHEEFKRVVSFIYSA